MRRSVLLLFMVLSTLLRALSRPLSRPLSRRGGTSHAAASLSQWTAKNRAVSFDQFSSKVKKAAPLSEVFAEFGVDVESRGGGRFMARCPFHGDGNERTPSMSIDDDKGVYYCHACKASGNHWTFLKEHENLEGAEAVLALSQGFDIELGESFGRMLTSPGISAPALTAEQSALVAANEEAARFYQMARRARARPGSDAYECAMLLRSRGVTNQVAERFGLGFADSQNVLRSHLRTTNVTAQTGVNAGLLGLSEYGSARSSAAGAYDRFRSRLMIPIHNEDGRVIGFGGRLLRDDPDGKSPKYLNTPETEVFKKGSLLYAYHLARGAIRERKLAIVVEVAPCAPAAPRVRVRVKGER